MSRRPLGSGLLAIISLCACGPPPADLPQEVEAHAQRFAEAVCEARVSCACDDERFMSQDSCESELYTLVVAAVEEGAIFDAECLETLLDSEAVTCAAWPWQELDVGACRVLSRERGVGEPCGWYRKLRPAHVEDCAEGLSCHAGVCAEDLSFEIEVGAACEQGFAQPCVMGAYCGADDVCHVRAGLDESCADFFGCDTGLYCAGFSATGAGLCSLRLADGEICDPRDWLPCEPEPPDASWKGCVFTDGAYRCVDETPGICYLTFPLSHP